jgi:hypothetical protein
LEFHEGKALKLEEKHRDVDEKYFQYLQWLEAQDSFSERDLLFHFPAFVGAVNLARFLSLVKAFEATQHISGHIGDFGTYKGGSFFTFAKLVRIFEPHSNTQVHGFDWFKGQTPGPKDHSINQGKYVTEKHLLESLIDRQELSGLMKLHDMDLVQDFGKFLADNPWLHFRLAFVDCGIEDVLNATIKPIWERMLPGGILLLDHFNHEVSPTETAIALAATSGRQVQHFPFSRSPTAFIVK